MRGQVSEVAVKILAPWESIGLRWYDCRGARPIETDPPKTCQTCPWGPPCIISTLSRLASSGVARLVALLVALLAALPVTCRADCRAAAAAALGLQLLQFKLSDIVRVMGSECARAPSTRTEHTWPIDSAAGYWFFFRKHARQCSPLSTHHAARCEDASRC